MRAELGVSSIGCLTIDTNSRCDTLFDDALVDELYKADSLYDSIHHIIHIRTEYMERVCPVIYACIRTTNMIRSIQVQDRDLAQTKHDDLCSALMTNTSVHALYIESTCLNAPQRLAQLAQLVKINTTITCLSIIDLVMDDDELTTLCHAVRDNSTLTELCMSKLDMYDQSGRWRPYRCSHDMEYMIKHNQFIHTFVLTNCEFVDDQQTTFVMALLHNTTMVNVTSTIWHANVRPWVQYLETHCGLTHIQLRDSTMSVTEQSIKQLTNAMIENTTLAYVLIDMNFKLTNCFDAADMIRNHASLQGIILTTICDGIDYVINTYMDNVQCHVDSQCNLQWCVLTRRTHRPLICQV